MMDDTYFSELVECPDCHKRCEWGSMIWLNGHCTCPQCYEHRRRVNDYFKLNQGKVVPDVRDGWRYED